MATTDIQTTAGTPKRQRVFLVGAILLFALVLLGLFAMRSSGVSRVENRARDQQNGEPVVPKQEQRPNVGD